MFQRLTTQLAEALSDSEIAANSVNLHIPETKHCDLVDLLYRRSKLSFTIIS